MKSYTLGLAALAHLASGQNTVTTVVAAAPSPPWTASAVQPAGTGTPGAAICGPGFTYCGYILRDHQSFQEEDIVKAYCAGNKDNCADGKTKTDPIQGLYVCLPPQANPKPKAKLIRGRQAASPVSSGVTPLTTFFSSTGSGMNSNTCSAVAAPGNRIELLCSCGNQCLNPNSDHIGRCDAPCV